MEGHAAGVVRALGLARPPLRAVHAVGVEGLEEVLIGSDHLVAELVQYRQVINHPEATALGSGDEVVVLDRQVGDRHHRHVHLKRLPVGTIVKTDVHARFRSCVQQAIALRIGPQYAGKVELVNAFGDQLPGGTVVRGMVQVRRVIAQLVAGPRYVSAALAEGVNLHAIEHHPLGHPFGRDVRPILTAITRDVEQSVVGAGPDYTLLQGRFCGGKYSTVVFYAGVILRNWSTGRAQFRGIVTGEVRTNDFPALAAIFRHVQVVGGGVQALGVMGREEDREVPLKAVLHTFGAVAHRVVWPYVDGLFLLGAVVEAGQVAAVATAVNDVVVQRIYSDVGTLATSGRFPVALTDGAAIRAVQDPQGAVVLLRAVDAVGEMIVGRYAIKLRGRLVVVGTPVFAGVKAGLRATVVGNDHPLVVFRGNPQIVVITVGSIIGFEGRTASVLLW